MRMRKISEKVPNLEDLVQKLLLVQGSGAYHLSAPLHCNTAKLPLTLVSGSSFLLGQFTAPQAPAACAAAHGGRLRGHVDGRKRARAQYPPGTNPAPDSLQNRHPPARRSGRRTLGLALRKDAPTPLAVRCFLDCLPYRN